MTTRWESDTDEMTAITEHLPAVPQRPAQPLPPVSYARTAKDRSEWAVHDWESLGDAARAICLLLVLTAMVAAGVFVATHWRGGL